MDLRYPFNKFRDVLSTTDKFADPEIHFQFVDLSAFNSIENACKI